MLWGLQDSIHPAVHLQMALICICIQHAGFGHPTLPVTSSVKLKNLLFCPGTGCSSYDSHHVEKINENEAE